MDDLSLFFHTLLGTFTGSIQVNVLVIFLLIFVKLIFDIIIDIFFKNAKKYLLAFFFLGAVFHQLCHNIMSKLLGYEIMVIYSLDYSENYGRYLDKQIKSIKDAFLIGYAPFLNIALIWLMILFHPTVKNHFLSIDFYVGTILYTYLLISMVFFSLPDFNDLLLPFITATSKHSELVFLFILSLLLTFFSISVWGWIIPTINFFICTIVTFLIFRKAEPRRPSSWLIKEYKSCYSDNISSYRGLKL